MNGPTTPIPSPAKSKVTLKDIASHTCAGLIATALSDEERFVETLQELDNLSEQEAKAVVKEIKAIRRKIDPLYNWED